MTTPLRLNGRVVRLIAALLLPPLPPVETARHAVTFGRADA